MTGVFASLRRSIQGATMHVDGHASEEELAVQKPERKTALHLQIYDVNHSGVRAFLRSLSAQPNLLQQSLDVVNTLLYDDLKSKARRRNVPRSVTLTIRSMDGVAYTTGKVLDDDHKEIHFSAEYINSVAQRENESIEQRMADLLKPTPTSTASSSTPTAIVKPADKGADSASLQSNTDAEIRGVLVHEIVHAVQFNGSGSCPGGLIEGIADWIRLKAGLAAPHWSPHRGGENDKVRWDSGYATTAFFLVWLEERLKVPDLVPLLNQVLATEQWNEGEALSRAAKQKVDLDALWKEYCNRKD